jgi:CheY-like chemotaxis protein
VRVPPDAAYCCRSGARARCTAYPSRMPIRVVLAEGNLLLRQGVRSLLELEDEIEVVDAVGDLDALFGAVAEHEPDVLVTDIRMPPTGKDEGVVAAKRLRQTQPRLGIVVLSQYDEPDYALALLAGGSERRAYLLKERVSDPEQLVDAIRAVASGGSYIDPKVVEALIAAYLFVEDLLGRPASTTRRVRRFPYPIPNPQLRTIAPDRTTTYVSRAMGTCLSDAPDAVGRFVSHGRVPRR